MGKFAMACPNCGRYVVAHNGLERLFHNRISCICGYEIDVKVDRMSSKVCPGCGNTVVYDLSLGEKAVCPVCEEPLNTPEQQKRLIELRCPRCSVHFQANENDRTAICPVCDSQVDITKEQAKKRELERNKISVIKYEGDQETLVWKHPLEDFAMGSQVIVHDSQEAVVFLDGKAMGPYTANRYVLEPGILRSADQTDESFADERGPYLHAEVYYINTSEHLGIRWGLGNKIGLIDPVTNTSIEIGVSGELGIRVTDSKRLLSTLVGTTGTLKSAELFHTAENPGDAPSKGQLRSVVQSSVRSHLAQVITNQNLNIWEIDIHLKEISEELRVLIEEEVKKYGLSMPQFSITRMVKPNDEFFEALKEQQREEYRTVKEEEGKKWTALAARDRKMVETQTDVDLELMRAKADAEIKMIRAEADNKIYRMQSDAEAEEMKAKGITYQQETLREVLLAQKGDALKIGVEMGWNCACGASGLTTKCCPECGKPRPVKEPWNCTCGASGITTKFCPECGSPRPVKKLWNCTCGARGISSKYCPECGSGRPDFN